MGLVYARLAAATPQGACRASCTLLGVCRAKYQGNMMSKNTKIVIGVVAVFFVCTFAIGFLLIISSSLYLSSSASEPSAQYFLTISEVMAQKDKMIDKQVRISGVVIGDTIEFDEGNGKLAFFIADVPADYAEVEKQGGLTVVLENALNDPNRQRIQVIYIGEKPELLRNMAQAILIGELHSNDIFYAEEILLRCPSRYEEAVPDQAIN